MKQSLKLVTRTQIMSVFKNNLKTAYNISNTIKHIFSKKVGKYIPVHVELMVSIQDSPERRSATYVGGINGKYTCPWRKIIDVKSVAINIPSCKGGFNSLLEGSTMSQSP